MEYPSIIAQIKSAIDPCRSIIEQANDFRNATWTETIKHLLGTLGQTLRYKICASTKERKYEAEWLYDLVWFKENGVGHLVDVPLVMECEWIMDLKAIKLDFEKLLLAKAAVKLMICEARADQKKGYLGYFQKALDACPLVRTDEVFLIAILNRVGKDAQDFDYYELHKSSTLVSRS